MPFVIAIVLLYEVALLGTVAYSWVWGGKAEKNVAAALLSTALVSQVIGQFGQHFRSGLEYGVAACDAALFVVLMLVVRRSRQFWPLWAAAAALVGLITHAVRWLRPSLARDVYATIQPFWVVPIMLAMVIGTALNRQRP